MTEESQYAIYANSNENEIGKMNVEKFLRAWKMIEYSIGDIFVIF